MSRNSSVTVLPVLVVSGLYGAVGTSVAVAAVLGLLALGALALGRRRVKLSRPAELLLSATVAVAAAALIATAFPRPQHALGVLKTPWSVFTAAVLALAVTRCYLARPLGGDLTTVALSLGGLTACGGTRSGWIYPAGVALFIVAAAVALRRLDRARAPIGKLGAQHIWALSGGLAIAGAVTVGWVLALPYLHQWAVQQIVLRASRQTGFSERLWLGSLQSMLLSDKRVLRVRGEPTDHLRGTVYTHYEGGRWSPKNGDEMALTRPPRTLDPATPRVTEIEHVERDPDYYFLPLEATQIAVSSGLARVNRAAILGPVAAEPAQRLWFTTEGRRPYPLAEPDERELQLPRRLARVLTPLAERWTEGARSPEAKLGALEDRLRSDYRYSLDFERPAEAEPLVDFLLHNPEGHCEYFASAMALLSRALKIPARVVGGYRVSEHSELGGYYIVRERDAHTWVEAWLPGQGWRSFDPTPPAATPAGAARTPLFAAAGDLLDHWLALGLYWLDQRTLTEALLAPLGPIFLLVLVRLLRWRRERRQQATDGARWASLPCFDRLSAALAGAGSTRAPGGTLERWAESLAAGETEGLPQAVAHEAGQLLLRYAALRYGDRGDQARLEDDIAELCTRLERRPTEH